MFQLKIALRSLIYRKNQYVSLYLVAVFGIGISLLCLFLSRGMIHSMSEKAEIYYGGDIVFMGGTDCLAIHTVSEFEKQLKEFLPADAIVTNRLDFDGSNMNYYYEGERLNQKTVKGVDFKTEDYLFSKLNFVEGGLPDISENMEDNNKVIISQQAAKKIGAKTGGTLTMILRTGDGYLNTVDLVISGIFKDSSVFGAFTSYTDREFLKNAFGAAENFANRICIDFPKKKFSDKDLQRLQARCEEKFNMFPLVNDKQVYYNKLLAGFSTPTYALITLKANLTDIKIMELAMDAVSLFIIFMLVLIIISGIGSTYRVLVMKRINEIGIYMAIGMKKKAILGTLLNESAILLFFSSISGIIFSLVLCKIFSMLNFSFIPSFDIFLSGGKLLPQIDIFGMLTVILSVIIVTIFAVFFSVEKTVRIMPVEALATTD